MEEEQYKPDTTATRPDKWLLNQSLLNIWFNRLLPTLNQWEIKKEKGQDTGLPELKSIITMTYWSIKSSYDKDAIKNKQPTVREIISKLKTTDEEEDIYNTIAQLEKFLYEKGVIKWDTKEVYDRTDIIAMNRKNLA